MDRKVIEKVIQGFFDASYAADPVKMADVLHSEMQLFGFNDDGGLVKKSKDSFVEGYRNYAKDPNWPDFPRVNEIISIDFTGDDVAVARIKVRIKNILYTDVFNFMLLNGEWRIIAKVSTGVEVE